MHRKFKENTLVIASHNQGKVREIRELLSGYNTKILSSSEFDLSEPEETGSSFIENAEIKSRYTAKNTLYTSLSDDSGLVVPALDGAPGIYSARWAGADKDFNLAMKKLEEELLKKTGTNKGHKAYFVCALSLAWPDGHVENFEGYVYGTLTFPPRGNKGFGYDPIFIPDGYNMTFGEMEPEEKHNISHRAEAFKKLKDSCFN